MAAQELVFKISATDAGLKSVMAQARAEIAQTARSQQTVTQGELSMRQQLTAAASLQRQRSAALVQQWKQQERAAQQLASGIHPVSTNLQRITDAMQSLRASTATLEGPLGGIAGRLGSIGSLATQAGSGVAGTAAAVGGLAAAAIAGEIALFKLHTTLFDLAKSAAEWRGALFDTSQQLGISTETLSAFEILAKTTGSDLGGISAALGIFQRNLEDAHDPTSKEAKLLNQLGIEATNTEDALRQTLTRLSRMPEGFKQTATAMELFGRGGKSILAILKEVDGDLDGAIVKFRELGLIISREDAKAADEFNDQLALLQFQMRALLGKDGIPAASQALKDLSKFLKDNKDAFDAINFVAGVTTTLFGGELARSLQVVGALWRQMKAPLEVAAELYERIGRASGLIKPVDFGAATAGIGGVSPPQVGTDASVGAGTLRKRRARGSGGGGGRSATDPSIAFMAGLREEVQKLTDSLAGLDTKTREYRINQEILNGALAKARPEVQALALAQAQQLDSADKFAARVKLITEFQREQAEAIRFATEGAKGHIQVTEEFIASVTDENNKLSESITFWLRFNAAILANVEARKMLIESIERLEPLLAGEGAGVPLGDDAISALAGAKADATAGIPPILEQFSGAKLEATLAGIDSMRDAFSGLGSAIGQAVHAFVLFGSAGTSFRKFTAEVLASVATQAAVKAVFELAEAFAMLALTYFTGNPKYAASAGAHFVAAATYGAIAGVAAAAGRGVAGNAFNSATGGNAGGGSGSAQPPQTIITGRNQRAQQPLEIRIRVDDSTFGKAVTATVVDDYNSGGAVREVIANDGS